MKALLLGLAVLVGAAAFAIGWATGHPPAELLAVRRVSAERPMAMLPNPNEASVASLDGLAAALGPSPPPPRPEGEAAHVAPAKPPEPDVAGIFRRQLTAVVSGSDGKLAALLSDEGPARMLKPGQQFMLGWKLTSLSMGEAVLGRGRDRKTIALFDPALSHAAPPPPARDTSPDASGTPLAQNDGVGSGEYVA